jgi:hypothetical protein
MGHDSGCFVLLFLLLGACIRDKFCFPELFVHSSTAAINSSFLVYMVLTPVVAADDVTPSISARRDGFARGHHPDEPTPASIRMNWLSGVAFLAALPHCLLAPHADPVPLPRQCYAVSLSKYIRSENHIV